MIRNDARALDKLRPVKITTDYIRYAEGSCLFELGNTRVICTASVDENVPAFLKGTLSGWITAEYGMIPRSCKTRISRDKNSGRTHEIQRLIGRSLRAVADLKSLGERTIWIDCDVIQADGGTRTASITGSLIALALALGKLKKQSLIKTMVLRDYVAATSVGVVEGSALLDLTYEEDSKAEVDMNIVMTSEGKFIEVQGTAEREAFSKERMNELLLLAQKGIQQLIEIQREHVAKYLSSR